MAFPPLLPTLACLAAVAWLHSCRRGEIDLYRFVPATTAFLVEADFKRIAGSVVGRKVLDSLVAQDDCLYPLLSEKVTGLVVGRSGASDGFYMLAVCPACSLDSLIECATRHLGTGGGGEAGQWSYGGWTLKRIGVEPPIFIGRIEKSLFAAGTKGELRKVLDLAQDKGHPLDRGKLTAGRGAAEIIFFVLDLWRILEGHDTLNGNGASVLPEELHGLDAATIMASFAEGKVTLTARLGFKEGVPAEQRASRLSQQLLAASSNPALEKIGLAGYLRKVNIWGKEKAVEAKVALTADELVEVIRIGGELATLEL